MKPELRGRLVKAQEIIQALEIELREADRGLIALTAELEARAAALEESEARFRLMVEGSEQVFFFTHDAEGRFTYLSPSVERVLGYAAEELLGEPYEALLTDSAENEAVEARTDAAIASGQRSETYTAVVRHRNGRDVCLEITEQPVTGPRGLRVMQGFARDVTEQRKRQDTLRETTRLMNAMIEASPAAIYVLDREERVELWNPAAEELFGWSAEEVVGRKLPVREGETEEGLRELIRRSLAGEALSAVDLRRTRKDGRVININVSTAPLHTARGRIDGIVAVVVDVSDKRLLEQQLLQAQKMEAIGRLAGGVAHDFNNILTALKGHAQFALDALPAASPAREEVEEVRRSAERAADLTRQLLAFSRRRVVRPRVADVAMVVQDMERMLRRIIGEDVELETRLGEGRVEADPGQLQQVLMNLVVNSRDAMPEGGRITMEVRPVEVEPADSEGAVPPGEYVRVVVADTGHGMDAETRQHLFEPFFTTKEVGSGTGLGLATVYGIVKNAGGEIRVESEPGAGTTFEVYLPRVSRPVDVPERTPADPPAERARASGTVLVVEDEAVVRKLVTRTLQRRGYEVLDAAGPREALALSDDQLAAVDLVVSDVVMPEMSGSDLVAALRDRRPDLRVMFMSGYTEDEVLRRGVADEGILFIEKPFSPAELVRKVEQGLLDR